VKGGEAMGILIGRRAVNRWAAATPLFFIGMDLRLAYVGGGGRTSAGATTRACRRLIATRAARLNRRSATSVSSIWNR